MLFDSNVFASNLIVMCELHLTSLKKIIVNLVGYMFVFSNTFDKVCNIDIGLYL